MEYPYDAQKYDTLYVKLNLINGGDAYYFINGKFSDVGSGYSFGKFT